MIKKQSQMLLNIRFQGPFSRWTDKYLHKKYFHNLVKLGVSKYKIPSTALRGLIYVQISS